ncbi:TetR/AcrR family transcriptional regulator [Levilactobacillus huananensis]|uniref:TetR/AcrR family transcriptional regulator n=1 Tax=Levilactobacillus huananensis TaxID=2486019 RepID=UPI000F7A00D8|nr:TetR/AcrR family transcriptional regulator [Levilactobacillus huananensis]
MEKISQEKIVCTASELITKTGRTNISLNMIADELGITHGALYKHFNNKQELWEAVASQWFQTQILDHVTQTLSSRTPRPNTDAATELHDWLWAFVTAKKAANKADTQMFSLNTRYIDNNPLALRQVLQPACQHIDQLMAYHDPHFERAETILSAFSIFTLPNFKDTWEWPDYQPRFEAMWALIAPGV